MPYPPPHSSFVSYEIKRSILPANLTPPESAFQMESTYKYEEISGISQVLVKADKVADRQTNQQADHQNKNKMSQIIWSRSIKY